MRSMMTTGPREAGTLARLGVWLVIASAWAHAGCWSYTNIFTPAISDADESGARRGEDGVGFGTLQHVRGAWLVFSVQETRTFLTGMAGASGDGVVLLADGTPLLDGVWRVMPPGWGSTSLSLQFCRGLATGIGDCVDVPFERPEGVRDLGFLSIIDPVNLGHTLHVTRSTASRYAFVHGDLTIHREEAPITSRLGVWVAPQFGTVFHCVLEAAGPRCRPALAAGRPVRHGVSLAVRTLRSGDGVTDVLWEESPDYQHPLRCQVSEQRSEPRCSGVQMQ